MRHTIPAQTQDGAPRRSRPWLAAGLVLSLLWAGTSTYLVLFHDEAVARLVEGEMAMQRAYEARIGELQARIEGARSAGVEGRAGLASRIQAALDRQAELERRQAALSGLIDTNAASPLPAAAQAYTAPLTGFELRQHAPADLPPSPAPGLRSDLDAEEGLIRLEARLGGLQAAQGAELGRLARVSERETARMKAAIARTGLSPARMTEQGGAGDGVGGPYVPLAGSALDGRDFAGDVGLVGRLVGQNRRLRRFVEQLPLRRPLQGDLSLSSPFGPRIDPFTRGLALHTGLDFKAEYGEPARATAAGVVSEAFWAGGYGNMVEIEHGHGLSTRFGHLSRVAVRPGQRIAAGDVVGYVGSTGRSTGSHLHYETRIDGEPVDPQRFLDAGRALDPAAG